MAYCAPTPMRDPRGRPSGSAPPGRTGSDRCPASGWPTMGPEEADPQADERGHHVPLGRTDGVRDGRHLGGALPGHDAGQGDEDERHDLPDEESEQGVEDPAPGRRLGRGRNAGAVEKWPVFARHDQGGARGERRSRNADGSEERPGGPVGAIPRGRGRGASRCRPSLRAPGIGVDVGHGQTLLAPQRPNYLQRGGWSPSIETSE